MESATKVEAFLPAGQLDSNKKYGFVKGVSVHALTMEEKQFLNTNPSVIVFHGFGEFRVQPKDSLDVLFIGEGFAETSTAEVWGRLCDALVPGGKLKVKFPEGITTYEDASSRLLLGGFINAKVSPTLTAVAEKPAWKPAAALPLKKKQPKASAWKLESTGDEVVDEDALLEENDCGGTLVNGALETISVKKKACKNCTCGLAEAENAVKIDLADSVVEEKSASSGCGNCAKGDAFRCGGCPYLGTPAFTPGTKPQVVLKSDGTKSLMIDVTSSDI